MGGIASVTNQKLEQDYYNTIVQTNQQYCESTVNTDIGTSVVIVTGGEIGGNFTGVEYNVNTDSSCLMVSAMESNVADILEATAQQTNTSETGVFSSLGSSMYNLNNENVEQTIINNIYQINSATCQATTTASTAGQYVYVSNTQVGGDFVGVSLDSDASASCAMNNMMKTVVYNQAAAQVDQEVLDEGMFASFFNSLASIIVGIIIVVIVIAIVVVLSSTLKSGKKSAAPAQPEGTVTIPIV